MLAHVSRPTGSAANVIRRERLYQGDLCERSVEGARLARYRCVLYSDAAQAYPQSRSHIATILIREKATKTASVRMLAYLRYVSVSEPQQHDVKHILSHR